MLPLVTDPEGALVADEEHDDPALSAAKATAATGVATDTAIEALTPTGLTPPENAPQPDRVEEPIVKQAPRRRRGATDAAD